MEKEEGGMMQDQIREQLRQLEWLLDGPFNASASRLIDALILARDERRLLWGLAGSWRGEALMAVLPETNSQNRKRPLWPKPYVSTYK